MNNLLSIFCSSNKSLTILPYKSFPIKPINSILTPKFLRLNATFAEPPKI